MAISKGSHIQHKDGSTGIVEHIETSVEPASVLVRWDQKRRNKPHATHDEFTTHVKITSIKERRA